MSNCKVCTTETAGLYLCQIHFRYLDEALTEIPWLLYQLDVTATKQDRLHQVQGHSEQSTRSVYNVGASTLADNVAQLFARWTEKVVAENGLTLAPDRPQSRAIWLRHHLNTVAGREDAKDFYFDVIELTGNPDTPKKPGRLVIAINRRGRTFAGMCPRVKGYDDEGAPVECGATIYAYDGADEAFCPLPQCGEEVKVVENKLRALTSRDLMPETLLLETLANIGEPVSHRRFHDWLAAGRVHIHGYLHATTGEIHQKPVRGKDPRVFSISQLRSLRWQHERQAVAS